MTNNQRLKHWQDNYEMVGDKGDFLNPYFIYLTDIIIVLRYPHIVEISIEGDIYTKQDVEKIIYD
ncbi:MAG TPA: hypothetical protein VEA37_12215 [Flavobacterium sp.]|nr:hypothetical protein [Flavobacterium sp.]